MSPDLDSLVVFMQCYSDDIDSGEQDSISLLPCW